MVHKSKAHLNQLLKDIHIREKSGGCEEGKIWTIWNENITTKMLLATSLAILSQCYGAPRDTGW